MSRVTERLMKAGTFEVDFIEETPPSVRDLFSADAIKYGFLGYVFVTPQRLITSAIASAAVFARYGGIMTRRTRRGISGVGVSAHLDWLPQGPVPATGTYSLLVATGSSSFTTWVTNAVSDTVNTHASPLSVGTITAIAGTLEWYPTYQNRREILDAVCTYFGGEYKVSPSGVVDAGPAANLFTTTPTRVILPRVGVQDLTLEGLQALRLEEEADVEDQRTAIRVVAKSGTDNAVQNASGSTVPRDLNGNDICLFETVDQPDSSTLSMAGIASAELTKRNTTRRGVLLSAADYDIRGKVTPGDNVYVYDPDDFLYDTSTQVRHGGRVIFPVSLRCHAVTWPIERGMGVYYYLGRNTTMYDLTDFVAFSDGGAEVEVGAPLRPLVTADPPSATTTLIGRVP